MTLITIEYEKLQQLEREMDHRATRLSIAEAQLEQMQKECAMLRAALRNFGNHHSRCPKTVRGPFEECACGFEELIRPK